MTGNDFARLIVDRVKAVKDRLGAVSSDSPSPWQRLTRRTFAERIGLTEKALGTRLRRSKPIPFSAHVLAVMCAEFGVRAEYMLRGEEPMLHSDLMDDFVVDIAEAYAQAPDATPTSGDRLLVEHFAGALHRHLTHVLAIATEQPPSWIASNLPEVNDLLRAVERGTGDALDANIERHVRDRLLANDCVRNAVSDRVHKSTPPTDVPDAFFKSAATGFLDGTVIDLKAKARRSRRS